MFPDSIDDGWVKQDVLKLCWFESPELPPSLLRVKKKRKKKETDQVHRYKANTEETEVKEPAQKKLRGNSPTRTRPVSNGNKAGVPESVVNTGNTSALTTTIHDESELAFDNDDINLSSLSDSDKNYY